MKTVNSNGFHSNGTAKHAGGRPSKYKPEYCQAIIDYFTCETYRQVLVKVIENTRTGIITKEYVEKGGDLRFISAFAMKIGVSQGTLHTWAKEQPEFLEAYNAAKELQKNHMIQNGVQGNYNPAFTIFTAKNITDMRDAPAVFVDNSVHTHKTYVKFDAMKEQDLVGLLLGRDGHTQKSS